MPFMHAGEPAERKLGYQDYLAFPDDGMRHEILDGVHYVSPTPQDPHQATSFNLTLVLGNFLKAARLGILRVAPSEVKLGEHDICEPDLYLVLAEHLGGFRRRGFHAPPDLMIEILSPSNPRYDLVTKLGRYQVHGVREYWIVDPERLRVEVYRREATDPGRFGRPLVLGPDLCDCLETPLLPGFSTTLAEVFDPGLTPPYPEDEDHSGE